MTRASLLVAALCGGCLIVPATKTTRRHVETVHGPATFGKARRVTLAATQDERIVRVVARRIGECARPVMALTELTTTKRARLGGVDDPRALALGVFVSPLTIPLSALVTGLIVAADRPQTSRETTPIGIDRFACSLEADQLSVTLTLPSGSVVRRITGRDGLVELEIPDSEPYAGSIAISAAAALPSQLAYKLEKPAINLARDAVLACGAKRGVAGSLMLKLNINDAGRVTRLWLSAGDAAFNACVSQRLAGVRFTGASRGRTMAVPLVLPSEAASL